MDANGPILISIDKAPDTNGNGRLGMPYMVVTNLAYPCTTLSCQR